MFQFLLGSARKKIKGLNWIAQSFGDVPQTSGRRFKLIWPDFSCFSGFFPPRISSLSWPQLGKANSKSLILRHSLRIDAMMQGKIWKWNEMNEQPNGNFSIHVSLLKERNVEMWKGKQVQTHCYVFANWLPGKADGKGLSESISRVFLTSSFKK